MRANHRYHMIDINPSNCWKCDKLSGVKSTVNYETRDVGHTTWTYTPH